MNTSVPRAAVLLFLASSFLLPACNDFERNAYRTLKVAKVEYELLQDHAARAYVQGRLTDEQWNRFAVAGHRFIAAHTLAADLMKTYQQARKAGAGAEENQRLQAQINAALAQLPVLLTDLRNLLASFDAPAPRSEMKPSEDPVEDPERSRSERSRRERRPHRRPESNGTRPMIPLFPTLSSRTHPREAGMA